MPEWGKLFGRKKEPDHLSGPTRLDPTRRHSSDHPDTDGRMPEGNTENISGADEVNKLIKKSAYDTYQSGGKFDDWQDYVALGLAIAEKEGLPKDMAMQKARQHVEGHLRK